MSTTDSIFLLGGGDALIEMNAASYDSEARLQQWLARWPNLLAGAQVNPEAPRQWLFVAREVGIPGEEEGSDQWSLDHLFLDQDGIPTFVEVKRSSDTRLRREVVGQMLDYAANAVVYWPPDRIRDLRRIRLLFVADKIPPELRRVVEFLNEQLDPTEVLALEIKQYVSGDMHTFVPRVFGQTAAAEAKAVRESRIWDEESFFDALAANCSEPTVEATRKIFDWMRDNFSTISYGTGPQQGSCGAGISKKRLFNVWTYGSLEVRFMYLKAFEPFKDVAWRQELLNRLNQVAGINLPSNAIDLWPGIPLKKLPDENAVQELISVLDWAVSEMRKAGSMPPVRTGMP